MLDACRFDERIQNADLVLTGEGKIDAQSAMGKTIAGVLKRALKYNIPVIAIAGTVSNDATILLQKGLLSVFSICDGPISIETSLKNAANLIEKTVTQIMRLYQSHL